MKSDLHDLKKTDFGVNEKVAHQKAQDINPSLIQKIYGF